MKRNPQHYILAITLALTCSSCSLFRTGPTKAELSKQAYERGYQAAQAHLMRQQAHEEQQRLAAPPEPMPKRYHEVPVPAHLDKDGILRDEHKVVIETIQPQANQ